MKRPQMDVHFGVEDFWTFVETTGEVGAAEMLREAMDTATNFLAPHEVVGADGFFEAQFARGSVEWLAAEMGKHASLATLVLEHDEGDLGEFARAAFLAGYQRAVFASIQGALTDQAKKGRVAAASVRKAQKGRSERAAEASAPLEALARALQAGPDRVESLSACARALSLRIQVDDALARFRSRDEPDLRKYLKKLNPPLFRQNALGEWRPVRDGD